MQQVKAFLLKLAKRIGHVQAWIILTLFYLVLLAPLAVVFRLCADPLRLRKTTTPLWVGRTAPRDRWTWARGQA